MLKRFEEIGSVKNHTIPRRLLSVTVEEKALDIAKSFVEDQRLSIRKAAQQHDTSRISVQRILKWIKFHPYKIPLVQELNEDDFDETNFVSRDFMMQRIDGEPNFLFNIFFLDEAIFEVNGNVNRYNCRDYGLIKKSSLDTTDTYTTSKKTERLGRCLKQYIDRAIFYWRQFDISKI